ncbi:hypothetical protein JCGZ_21533 [Jatropha curcas]|uniref:Uncharacterized protein n=1 Tax=Jatropha curcas TaxID=180498 RepID=A0A067JBB6_JATCU|nr:hypothetical protein JCGZ_21533 [Jatropha curcas]
MAFLSRSENRNKENIPPLYSELRATLDAKSPRFPCDGRRARKPLEDITHLFNQPIYSISPPQNRIPVYISSSLPCQLKCGKRRAVGGGVESMCKKTNVVYSSKNFR